MSRPDGLRVLVLEDCGERAHARADHELAQIASDAYPPLLDPCVGAPAVI